MDNYFPLCVNLMKFNKAKYLHQGKLKHKYRLDREWIESSPKEDWGMLVAGKWDMIQQSALTAKFLIHICVRRTHCFQRHTSNLGAQAETGYLKKLSCLSHRYSL